MADLKNGSTVQLTNGGQVTVQGKLGEGGQGAVYKVTYDGKDYALKWYLPDYLKRLKPDYTAFFKNLKRNVQVGSPSPAFLWQKAIAKDAKSKSGFGYLMDLRPKEYEEFTRFIKARVHFSSTRAVINAAVCVAEAFQALHRKGFSYQDLSPGNFFINKDTGDVLICDNDNVAPDGENLGVGGTPGYMAPEVILGQAKPCTETDLFSLSVILFELFFLSHPLEGANCCKYPCLTQTIERELYAKNPVFVMSNTDRSNAPVRGTCSNLLKLWPAYPEYLHDAFGRAFGPGLKDGQKRLTENEWKKVFYRLQDESITCPHCHEINFGDMAINGTLACTCCRKTYPVPYRVEVNGFTVYSGKDASISEYHISRGSRDSVVAVFTESKKTPGLFGLKNESAAIWNVTYPGKPAVTYEPGKVVTPLPGTEIAVGSVIMRIVQ